ncbi:MAG TPA: AgmX/PglI C-terminal domain-containing protein [Polyangiaceae bacterium]
MQGAQILSGYVHLAVLAALALVSSRLPADEPDAESIGDRIALMRALLNASGERERVRIEPPEVGFDPAEGQGGDGLRGGGTGTRAMGEEGSPGSSVSQARGGRASVLGRASTPTVSRDEALRDAASFGMIGTLATLDAPGWSTTPWHADATEGTSTTTTRAPLWGGTLEDSFAWGGLALTGTGEGGGGRAPAIGLGNFGALGRGAGTGTNAALGPGDGLGGIGEGAGGWGRGIAIGAIGGIGHTGGSGFGSGGAGGWGRFARGPTLRGGDDGTLVNGRLPPEVIQRIVRQNMGRFRYCYERALDSNPTLQGRVVTRFVIGRDGSVAFSADEPGETAFPDAGVVSCIVRAFGALSFPQPEGGTVHVIYPLSLTPAG